jgi:hypothetical protein
MRLVAFGAVTAILASGCLIAVPDAPAEAGSTRLRVAYSYQLFTHCGLDTVPIRFDGSEWRILGDTGHDGNPPPGFMNPSDNGTIILVTWDRGIYHSSWGAERIIVRERSIPPHAAESLGACI